MSWPGARRACAWIVAVVLIACSGDGTAPTAAPSGAACDEGDCVPVCEGTACRPLGWTACPEGFSSVVSGRGCEPVLAPEPCAGPTRAALGKRECQAIETTCGGGFRKLADGVGCEAILPKTACQGPTRVQVGEASCVPVGTCSSDAPTNADTFVDPTFSDAQLDATHVRTIGAALALPTSKVIAIAKGTYKERITIPRSDVELVGRCAADVIVDGSSFPNPLDGVIASGVKGVRIRGITLRDNKWGINAAKGATVEVADVVIDKNVLGGLIVNGAGTVVRMSKSVVRDGYPGSIDQNRGGMGAQIDAKAKLEVVDSSFERSVGLGLHALTGGVVELERVALVDTLEDDSGAYGVAAMQRGGTLRVSSSAVSNAKEVGFGCFGGTCSIKGSTVHRVLGSPARSLARGIQVIGGAAEVEDVTVAACAQAGLWAETKADVSIAGLTVRQIGSGSDREQASIVALDAVKMKIDRSVVYETSAVGIRAQDAGTSVEVTNTFVGEVRPKGKVNGRGVEAWDGARLSFSRGSIERVAESGVISLGAGSEVTLEDTVIDGTRANSAQTYGFGVAVTEQGKLTARRLAARFNLTMGIIVTDSGSSADLSDTFVSDTDIEPVRSRFGRGLQVQEGASAVASRIMLTRNTEVGAAVVHPGSRLDLSETLVTATRPSPLRGVARGLVVQTGALSAKDTLVLDLQQAGISVATDGELTLDHVNVSRSKPDPSGHHGHAIIANSGRVRATDVQIRKSAGAGFALLGASASISRSRVEDNAVGITARDAQIEERPAAPAVPEPHKVIVSSDTVFSGNGARVGSGSLALPDNVDESAERPSKP